MSRTTRRLPHGTRRSEVDRTDFDGFGPKANHYYFRAVRFNNRLGRDGGLKVPIACAYSDAPRGYCAWRADEVWDADGKRSTKREVARIHRRRSRRAEFLALSWEDGE